MPVSPSPGSAKNFSRATREGSAALAEEILPDPAEPIPGRTVVVSWDPNPEPVDGYRVYLGDSLVAEVEETMATLEGLDWSASHTLAVTAYTAAGLESPRSESLTIDPPPLSLDGSLQGEGSRNLQITGWPGAALDVEESPDLKGWSVHARAVLDASGKGSVAVDPTGVRQFWRVLAP